MSRLLDASSRRTQNRNVLENRVRARRSELGLSQKYVAAAVEVSRQSLNAIETARATPNVLLALKLARVLESDVEALFGDEVREEREAVLGAAVRRSETRVLLGVVRERWVAHPLGSEFGKAYAADGFVRSSRGNAGSRVRVELARPASELADTLFVGGCAPGLGVLMDRLNGVHGRYRWLMQANNTALRAWASGHTHIAGVHLPDEAPARVSRLVARHLPTEHGSLHAFAKWEAGLVVAPGNPLRIRDVAGMMGKNVRVSLREEGSGARVQLARLLRDAGLELAPILPRALPASSHFAVAQAVQLGAADTGFAIRAVAVAFGLDFVPLIEERFDLALPDDVREDTRTLRLLDVLSSRNFRRELGELGYDAAHAGEQLCTL